MTPTANRIDKRTVARVLDELEPIVAAAVAADEAAHPGLRGRCIGASRLAALALARLGIKATATPCATLATTSAYRDALRQDLDATNEADAKRLVEAGAFCMHVGPADRGSVLRGTEAWTTKPLERAPGRPYDGHVVLNVERRWLLDLTAGQMNRPERGLHVPPTVRLDVQPWASGRHTRAWLDLEAGGLLEYRRTGDASYLRGSAWTSIEPRDPQVIALADRLAPLL